MEDTLGVRKGVRGHQSYQVLILIVMEDTLGEDKTIKVYKTLSVLILIMMEQPHYTPSLLGRAGEGAYFYPYCNGRYSWRSLTVRSTTHTSSLNPYCNGRCFWRVGLHGLLLSNASLNPYCNGRYSQSKNMKAIRKYYTVLILVLMEDTLRARSALRGAVLGVAS